MQAVARGAKRTLCALNLGGCFKVTNVGISIVADHGSYLEVLNLGGCQLMDFDVEDVCRKCVRLRVLDLRACTKITARRRDSAEDFSRLGALLCTATDWIFIPAHCFAIP